MKKVTIIMLTSALVLANCGGSSGGGSSSGDSSNTGSSNGGSSNSNSNSNNNSTDNKESAQGNNNNGNSGGATNNQETTFKIQTGKFEPKEVYQNGKLERLEYGEGDAKVSFVREDKSSNVEGINYYKVYAKDELYKYAGARSVLLDDSGAFYAAGANPNGAIFAAAKYIDGGAKPSPADTGAYFTGVNWGYYYVDAVNEKFGSVVDDNGFVRLIGENAIDGRFGDATMRAEIDGTNITKSEVLLNFNGSFYPGEVVGGHFGDTSTAGAFVSTNPTDQVLFSGGWSVTKGK